MEISINMLHTMVPEEHNLAFGNLLGPLQHQLYYIVKMPTKLNVEIFTNLLLYGSFLGLMSSLLNQAK